MNKREPLLTVEYFEGALHHSYEALEGLQEDALLPPEQIRQDLLYLDYFSEHLELLRLKYSRGYPVEELRPELLASIAALEKYRTLSNEEEGSAGLFFNGEQDEYMQAVELVSLALLLHIDLDTFQRLVTAIGANGQDYVLEWLIRRRLSERPPTTTQLLFPKTYARLRDTIQAPADLQPQLLRSFLAGWYESLNTVWYNIHAHRQDAAGFTGYWCWEAAATAYGLGLDDGELQAMRYYPEDLADYAFGRKPTPT